jgi:hypothetical protein
MWNDSCIVLLLPQAAIRAPRNAHSTNSGISFDLVNEQFSGISKLVLIFYSTNSSVELVLIYSTNSGIGLAAFRLTFGKRALFQTKVQYGSTNQPNGVCSYGVYYVLTTE